ncbi:MAG: metabolite traffic protein EboE [Verrucomicrobiales bacterium]|nr:metabolite traffic protein EboE [Verrucomicrobiales bacterium]
MRLLHDIDLGYCTNIHRGETWAETFAGLRDYTNQVRQRVCPNDRYGIGLRLSAFAARELADDRSQLDDFRAWMDRNDSYVFTINGFPFGTFHGSRVKEQVYVPDWTTPERLAYTTQLFDLLVDLAPDEKSLSVSTLPGSFKEFIRPETEGEQLSAMVKNLRACVDHIEALREKTGKDLHLGLEPEPLGLFETTPETVEFFGRVLEGCSADESERISRNLGVNYDTCHLAIEYEEPAEAIGRLRDAGVRISKVHLSSALRLEPGDEAVKRLEAFQDEIYLHQVVVRNGSEVTERFRDLSDALSWYKDSPDGAGDEWRVHFHVPIHAQPEALFADTRDHISGLLALLGKDPGWCSHFEMETYTWEVLPVEIRTGDVVDQLVAEYDWCLGEFRTNQLA